MSDEVTKEQRERICEGALRGIREEADREGVTVARVVVMIEAGGSAGMVFASDESVVSTTDEMWTLITTGAAMFCESAGGSLMVMQGGQG